MPPNTGGRASKSLLCNRDLRLPVGTIAKVVPAGNPSAGYGGRCVEALRLPV